MIKLTLLFDSTTTVHSFNKTLVVIGSPDNPEADLHLPKSSIKPFHLKIQEQEGSFLLINTANDPFATLNRQAFGKKIIKSKDIIMVGGATIHFEGVASTVDSNQFEQNLSESLESLIESKRYSPSKTVTYKWDKDLELNTDSNSDWIEQEEADFDLLAEELELMEQRDIQLSNSESSNSELPPIHEAIQAQGFVNCVESSMKPSAFEQEKKEPAEAVKRPLDSNFEQSRSKLVTDIKKQTSKIPNNQWKYLLVAIFTIIILIVISLGIVYMKLIKKRELQETRAAEGVADVTMALTYAHINRIHPQAQNWSDPEFLKNNLTSILASDYVSLANIDSHGHFKNSPYILRIYTNSDLSHFLVVALPAPSVLQWLIPKNAIIVDSAAMELRKIQDLRSLNRLLVNPNTLEGSNGKEISAIVKQGILMPLSSIGEKMHNQGFNPPKALALIRPGAENLIYNAPRYYQFGENYMKRAVNVAKAPEGAVHELARLQQDVGAVSKLTNMVLYSSQGIDGALQAQKALATFTPQTKFLSAYLQFNNSGEIVSSKLLMDSDRLEATTKTTAEVTLHSLHPEWSKLTQNDNDIIAEATRQKRPENLIVNEGHPLFSQFKALTEMRKAALEPSSAELVKLITRNTNEFSLTFSAEFNKTIRHYLETDQEARRRIVAAFKEIYKEYPSMPLAEVMPYLEATGLNDTIQEMLENEKVENTAALQEISHGMKALAKARDFMVLQQTIDDMIGYLNLNYVNNPKVLIDYQNNLRNLSAKRLEYLLLSPLSPLTQQDFNEENRLRLSTILESIWMTDSDEYEFFMREFDTQMSAAP